MQQNKNYQQPSDQAPNSLGVPSGYVPVYNNPDKPSLAIPANPLKTIVLVGGLILAFAGIGSTVFGSFQGKQDIEAIKQQAVEEALLEQQNQLATCVNGVFDGKSAQPKKKSRKN